MSMYCLGTNLDMHVFVTTLGYYSAVRIFHGSQLAQYVLQASRAVDAVRGDAGDFDITLE